MHYSRKENCLFLIPAFKKPNYHGQKYLLNRVQSELDKLKIFGEILTDIIRFRKIDKSNIEDHYKLSVSSVQLIVSIDELVT